MGDVGPPGAPGNVPHRFMDRQVVQRQPLASVSCCEMLVHQISAILLNAVANS